MRECLCFVLRPPWLRWEWESFPDLGRQKNSKDTSLHTAFNIKKLAVTHTHIYDAANQLNTTRGLLYVHTCAHFRAKSTPSQDEQDSDTGPDFMKRFFLVYRSSIFYFSRLRRKSSSRFHDRPIPQRGSFSREKKRKFTSAFCLTPARRRSPPQDFDGELSAIFFFVHHDSGLSIAACGTWRIRSPVFPARGPLTPSGARVRKLVCRENRKIPKVPGAPLRLWVAGVGDPHLSCEQSADDDDHFCDAHGNDANIMVIIMMILIMVKVIILMIMIGHSYFNNSDYGNFNDDRDMLKVHIM